MTTLTFCWIRTRILFLVKKNMRLVQCVARFWRISWIQYLKCSRIECYFLTNQEMCLPAINVNYSFCWIIFCRLLHNPKATSIIYLGFLFVKQQNFCFIISNMRYPLVPFYPLNNILLCWIFYINYTMKIFYTAYWFPK